MASTNVSSVKQQGGVTLGAGTPREMKTAYYARCQAIYGTPQEDRDIKMINRLGYAVIPFPSQLEIEGFKLSEPEVNIMDHFFKPLVKSANVLFFRALPSLEVPAGVGAEVGWALELAKPVLELPSLSLRTLLSPQETRAYLAEVGQR